MVASVWMSGLFCESPWVVRVSRIVFWVIWWTVTPRLEGKGLSDWLARLLDDAEASCGPVDSRVPTLFIGAWDERWLAERLPLLLLMLALGRPSARGAVPAPPLLLGDLAGRVLTLPVASPPGSSVVPLLQRALKNMLKKPLMLMHATTYSSLLTERRRGVAKCEPPAGFCGGAEFKLPR